jgi:hypothetical protein
MPDLRTNAFGRVAGSTLLVAVLAAGCTSTHPAADPPSRSTSSATSAPTTTTPTVSPKAAAVALAHHFVSVAILPPGARPSQVPMPPLLRGPWETTGSVNLVVANRVWKVNQEPSAVVAYLRDHAPRAFAPQGVGSVSDPASRVQYVVDLPLGTPLNVSDQALEIGVADGGAGSSLVNVVGGVQWTAPKPTEERVPGRDRVAIVSVFRTFEPGRPVVRRVVVTDATRVAELTRGFDQLRVAAPGRITNCVMLTNKTVAYRIAFATTPNATPDLVVTDAICSPISVTVNGRRSADLSDSGGAFGSAVAHALGQSVLSFR